MEIEISKVQDVVEAFKDGQAYVPREVAQALIALIGDSKIVQAIAVYGYAEESSCATWNCMALVNGAAIHVHASRVGGEWYTNDDEFDAGGEMPAVDGGFIPLAEVAAIQLLELKSSSLTRWLSRWQLQLRNGAVLPIPWPRHPSGREQHEKLARAVADQLT